MSGVVVYSKNNCPACERAKALLTSKRIAFTVRNIDKDLSAMDFVVENNFRAMPVVLKDGAHITDLTTLEAKS